MDVSFRGEGSKCSLLHFLYVIEMFAYILWAEVFKIWILSYAHTKSQKCMQRFRFPRVWNVKIVLGFFYTKQLLVMLIYLDSKISSSLVKLEINS